MPPVRAGGSRALALAPALTLALMLGPLAAGLGGTLLPAFGYLPALGGDGFSLAPWRALLAEPGLARAAQVSAFVGIVSTLISLAAVMAFCAAWQGTRAFSLLQRVVSPLLSVPHAATALALAFLIAPSGWLARMVSPWATGWTRPPDLLIVHDEAGLALIGGLVLKEIPFLFLMTLAALNQVDADARVRLARTLGYGRMAAWLKAVFPAVYAQIRLPVYAVLAYAMSVVDMAIILGPTNPPTLSVLVLRWANDPDLALRFQAAAGATLQLLIVLAGLALWRLLEMGVARAGLRAATGGARMTHDGWGRGIALLPVAAIVAAVIAGLGSLALWSAARVWRFPDALPTRWTAANWTDNAARAGDLIATSAGIAALAALIALVLTVACLERETGRTHTGSLGAERLSRALPLLYAPLIVPQIAFLFGLQVFFVRIGIDGTAGAVVWAHLVFVLPYAFLAMADPYRAYDPRYVRTALCLGVSGRAAFWRVKLPMLLRPLLVAFAVGFAISVGQYLPTVFAGAGRVPTVTTEAVALAASADRRLIGIFALLQAVLPFAGFALATAIPALAFRSRRGLQVR